MFDRPPDASPPRATASRSWPAAPTPWSPPVAALGLDAGTLESWLPLNLLTPVAIVHAVLPGMLARGSGAVLVAQGATARQPMPDLASTAVPQAGLLAYLHSVSLVTAPRGVYVGSLLIGALVERSAAAELFDGGHFEGLDAGDIRRVDPDVIAERFWRMARDGSPVETAVP
jgi:short-subunit dehydrogenase